jgi:hypothetical protein
MAECQSIMSPADIIEFAAFLFSEFDVRFHVDDSTSPTPQTLSAVNELRAFLDEHSMPPLLHVTSPQWTVRSLETQPIQANDGRRYFAVRQRYGGPAFVWMLSRHLRKESGSFFTSGTFTDYPWYYVRHGSSETFDRPNPMTEAYNDVMTYIRRTSIRSRWTRGLDEPHQFSRPGPWVGQHAVEQHRSGVALGPDNEWHIDEAG